MKEEYINYLLQTQNPHFFIELAGTSYCDESYKIKRTKSELLIAEYVMKGEGTVVLDGKSYIAKENDIYLLPMGKDHMYYSDSQNPWQKLWFNVRGTLVMELLREYNPRNIVVFENAGGEEYFKRIHEIGNSQYYTTEEKQKKSALVFHELLQYLYDGFYKQEYLHDKEIRLMLNYMDTHFPESISLKELCDLVYLSETQVIRIFKKNTGKTPYEYYMDLRLNQGKRMLQNTSLMVQEIAACLGFSDAHYFSYLFRKKTGKTPLEYRRKA